MTKLALTGGLCAGLTALLLIARPAAADVGVSVQLPTVQVSVNGPQGPAPGPGYVWEPERWEMENGAWVRRGGYWRPGEPPVVAQPVPVYQPIPTEVVEVDMAPPPPVVEVRTHAPHGGAVWIPGYWQWTGRRHVWVAGHWVAGRPAHVWEPHRWYRRGHRWAHAPGHWRPVHGDHRWQGRHDRDRHHDRRDRHHGRRHHHHGHRR